MNVSKSPPPRGGRSLWKNILFYSVTFLVIIGIFSLFSTESFKQREKISLSQLVQQINDSTVEQIVVTGSKLEIKLSDGQELESNKEANVSLVEVLDAYQVDKEKLQAANIEVKDDSGWEFWLGTILPFVIPLIVIVGFIWFMSRSIQGSNNRAISFGQSSARKTPEAARNRIRFTDVAGAREAKEELKEIVEFLKEPTKFLKLGAKIPKGALLMGPPGTGKTLLAKAVAGEANVPFFHMSGSEFVEMFVGVGASRVRDLFKRAKKDAPAIVFIDEIDAVGRQRGAGLGGSHDEREQTLNQILVEMDGFDTSTNVIVMAATNRPDVLDPALLRPGRFDRRVILEFPDIKDRMEILAVHSRKKPLAKDVDLKLIAQRTPGFSGADLENLLNEAAILAARRNKKTVGAAECMESIEKVMLGPERKSKVLSKEEKEVTAYHEAGHAVVAHYLPHVDPVHKVSIISRGAAGGYTMNLPDRDKHLHTRQEFIEQMSVLLGGYTVEKYFFGDVSTGASSDLHKVTELARDLVTRYGMSERIGPISYTHGHELVFLGKELSELKEFSEETQAKIDHEIHDLIERAHERTKHLVAQFQDKIIELADELIETETLERGDVEKILGKREKPAKIGLIHRLREQEK